jgi:NAD(P)-dependent dehydrogenase (short-subunit alcohol dehydrogenase family)
VAYLADLRFTGRVAVVTGAGQGLGREIALALAREGAEVALVARSRDRLEEVAEEIAGAGGRAFAVPADLRDPASVETLRDAVLDRAGTVDVLVNNAGVAGATAPLWEQPVSDWDETLRVNVTGVFLCCRAFLPTLVARGSGSVIVIGSMTGKRPLLGRSPYATSKTALIGLVRTLATDAGTAGVRVNLISPGPVAGERLERVIAQQAEAKGVSRDAARLEFASASPLRRFATAADIAAAVLFLASDAAMGITGEDLNVSAGAVTYG